MRILLSCLASIGLLAGIAVLAWNPSAIWIREANLEATTRSTDQKSMETLPEVVGSSGGQRPLQPPQEPPIEDLLRDEGEDPEAVAFMSGVREALREGNPTFARELYEKMKERHGTSVLLQEAESLIEQEN